MHTTFNMTERPKDAFLEKFDPTTLEAEVECFTCGNMYTITMEAIVDYGVALEMTDFGEIETGSDFDADHCPTCSDN